MLVVMHQEGDMGLPLAAFLLFWFFFHKKFKEFLQYYTI